jgi:hypothetical protein
LRLTPLDRFPGLRALAWQNRILYASRGYSLLSAEFGTATPTWLKVASFRAPLRRKVSSVFNLSHRLFRDGFHALAVFPSGHMVAAVPGAIVTRGPADEAFQSSHRITRGTRPLHFATLPDGQIYWGEYFDNRQRDEVHIYGSADQGKTWHVAYTFAKGTIRHVHNIVFDPWGDCLWILTGDDGQECRILHASRDLRTIDTVLSGNQQARAVALIPTKEAINFSSDTPSEANHVFRLDRSGQVSILASINASSICGCRVGNSVFFSTMVEPSAVNRDRTVRVYGSPDGTHWNELLNWKKDGWPSLFQYGNAFFPDGDNATNVLAISTVAVVGGDLVTHLYRVESPVL